AEAQYLADQVTLKSRELKENENKSAADLVDEWDAFWIKLKNFGSLSSSMADGVVLGEERKKSAIEKTKLELEAAKEAYKDYLTANPSATTTESEFVSGFTGSTGGEDKSAENAAAKKKKLIDELNKDILEA